ncbi:MAG: glycosyltransferase family 2 protein [Acidobacteria bacterium]|nr:glycosyltransferase family 2 protein [Thermoanaerobaculia bacterium]MDI9630941.1 glycosyltransferase family 2 protein [Acidobacteriota bacterium]MBP8844574.1 glycosyltransferase family 2 protein [Thermoanaerobaculia bacterium]NLN10098.1 glycosyltransferase family 2 protein [Acidobacteriota bacterium]HNZ97370.1 glycosyltransferase family 2 protein [Thermoanaerobaculia bacterium]
MIVTTYNEEVNIAGCLESVQWADEVLLVDSYSTDRTLEIAAGYDVKVLQREYFGSAAQKNWSIDRVSHDWVLIIDADERVPPPLAAEILRTLATPQQVNGFSIRRENIFIDKVVRHSGWSTDKVVRLFRRDKGRYPNRRVHADLEIEGPVPVLRNPFEHNTFRSFDQYFPKFLNYAEWGAAQAFRDGRKAGFTEVAGRPFWRFLRTYFLQLGFLDGRHGLVLCLLQSFGVFLKYARLWEYNIRSQRGDAIQLPAFDDSESTWKRPGES